MNTPTPFYAASPFKSGIFTFPTEPIRDDWIAENRGYVVDRDRIDPVLLAEMDAEFAARFD